ncbi:MAG: hypothetical protein EA378_01555 [Phycisphaerales bacterium]|nr:MAG: hypothetical protein EA378_01555 [Phycisphaerales bacterium]
MGTTSTAHQKASRGEPSVAVDDLRELAESLVSSLQGLLKMVPGAPHKPTPLARELRLNRVIVSRLLGAVSRPDPFEALQQMPGPDSLRAVARAAAVLGVPRVKVRKVEAVIDRFSAVIRDHFGTRGALNAAISAQSTDNQKRFELGSRYHVYKGMRQILGVEAETWLTSMLFSPSPESSDTVALTTIHGAVGMRRLRPDVQMYFTFGEPSRGEAEGVTLSRSPAALTEFYTHEPAQLETHVSGGQLVHRLVGAELGKHAVADMLAVSRNTRGSRRFAAPGRALGGLAVTVDIPVKTLVCDAIIHEDLFPDADPELLVYKLGAHGPANPNDAARDIDRLTVPETIEHLPNHPDRFELPEIPNYERMLARVCAQDGLDLDAFRVYRLRMAYPVHGFQFTMAFEAPPDPADA